MILPDEKKRSLTAGVLVDLKKNLDSIKTKVPNNNKTFRTRINAKRENSKFLNILDLIFEI